MNIVVLAGGTSTERAVSIVSGTQVAKALLAQGHRIVLTDVFAGVTPMPEFLSDTDVEAAASYMHSFDDRIEEIKNTRKGFFGPNVLALCEAADAVFMALHGSNGEDGRIQATFDLLGIPYTGSGYLGSALAMDKEIAKRMFRDKNVPTPAGIAVSKTDAQILSGAENGVGFPCVVKPSCGGSSVGVSIVHDQQEYEKALEEGFRYEQTLIVEQYISGREFSVGIVDGEVYPVIEIAPIQGFYDYHNKYAAGSTVETCPADLNPQLTAKMQGIALDAYNALGLCSYGRIDVMMDAEENIFCLEANTLPGMTPTSLLPQEAAVLGLSFAQLCDKLIQVSLKRN